MRYSASRHLLRALAALILLAPVLAPVGCTAAPIDDPSGSGGIAHTGKCAVPDKSLCGTSCALDVNCEGGLYCDVGSLTCQADCLAVGDGSDCGAEASCSATGRCVTKPVGSGGVQGAGGGPVLVNSGGSGTAAGGAAASCIEVDLNPMVVVPNVVFLIDRSASMDARDGFGTQVQAAITAGDYVPWECSGAVVGAEAQAGNAELWRWNVVRTALFNPTDGVITALQDRVRFGMSLYSAVTGGAVCPELVDVALALDNREAMLASYLCSDYIENTPTRESLTATANAFAALAVDGPKVLVLATDGAPDSCACPNDGYGAVPGTGGVPAVPGCTTAGEQPLVIEEARRIHDELGITVHVVDVSSATQTTLRTHLTQVAQAGGGELFDGTQPATLVDAFQTIVGDVVSCVVELGATITSGSENLGVIVLNEIPLVYGDPNGWTAPMPTQVELLGTACETFKTGSPVLTIDFPCGVIIK